MPTFNLYVKTTKAWSLKDKQCCRCAKTLLPRWSKKVYACMQDFCIGQDNQQAAVQYGVAAMYMISAADAIIMDAVLCGTPMAGLYDTQALCRCSSKLTTICSGTCNMRSRTVAHPTYSFNRLNPLLHSAQLTTEVTMLTIDD